MYLLIYLFIFKNYFQCRKFLSVGTKNLAKCHKKDTEIFTNMYVCAGVCVSARKEEAFLCQVWRSVCPFFLLPLHSISHQFSLGVSAPSRNSQCLCLFVFINREGAGLLQFRIQFILHLFSAFQLYCV